jgi:hypothetical protein
MAFMSISSAIAPALTPTTVLETPGIQVGEAEEPVPITAPEAS